MSFVETTFTGENIRLTTQVFTYLLILVSIGLGYAAATQLLSRLLKIGLSKNKAWYKKVAYTNSDVIAMLIAAAILYFMIF